MMNESKKQTAAADSLQKAKYYMKETNWARAFAHFLLVFELLPNEKHKYELEFENVLFNVRLWLENKNQIENIFNSYVQAIRHFPSNVRMLNDFGSYWLRIHQSELALQYLEAAHELDENFLLAEKNLQTAKLNIVPRWHFRMLNDVKRNQAYCDAINKALTGQYNKVLDIGAGCGLLSFYASQCKDVERIVSIESSNTLADIAKNCLRNVNFTTVINSTSTALDSDNIGLSNILVTEVFDTALFGEHVLETLIHAWDNLLESSSKIIPCSADLYITAISSDIINKHKITNEALAELNLRGLCVTERQKEPYEAENLNDKNVKYVTCTERVLHINFNDVQHLKQIYMLENSIQPVTLKCLQNGIINAFAVWFDLHLDETITITTNPLKDNVKCWEQAVIYLDHPLMITKDQLVKLKVSCTDNMLNVNILDVPVHCTCFKISSDMITFINDVHILETAKTFELPTRFNDKHSVILDLNPAPLFSLFQARNNVPGHYIWVGANENDCTFLNMLWKNNVDAKKTDITFEVILQENIFDKILEGSIDVIFINPISENGILSEDTYNKLSILNAALKKDGLLLPQNVYLQMEIIDSRYLEFCSRVDEENLLGFRAAAGEINKYAIMEQWQIQQESFPREVLGVTKTSFNILDNLSSSTDVDITTSKEGIVNGVLYGYILEYNNQTFVDTSQSSHYNKACFIFKQPQPVCSGDTLTITVIKEDGLLKIICKNKT